MKQDTPRKRPVQITLLVTEEENEAFLREIAKTGQSISGFVRGLITDGLRYRRLVGIITQKISFSEEEPSL